ncbi:MAG: ArsA family ATPase [Thermoleophilaceae bacterium]|nr:ArsA family ATPase [Thermoleophilaceae bacterium]
MTESVDLFIEGKRVVICAGSGGVGKTTTAAAIAMGLASRGKRVAVLTIDPARRLAQSLGLEELDNEARRVEPERFARAGVEMRGELWAMMLDAKRTFDELVERYAPDSAARDRLLGNRIYAEISNAVSGSQEYMAIEKLNELDAEARYDALVLDTPTTRNALEFLDAPSRLSRFINSRALGALIKPGGRMLGRGSSLLLQCSASGQTAPGEPSRPGRSSSRSPRRGRARRPWPRERGRSRSPAVKPPRRAPPPVSAEDPCQACGLPPLPPRGGPRGSRPGRRLAAGGRRP